MEFRRSGQRDPRRRRVLTDLLQLGTRRRRARRSTRKLIERKSENYGDAVFLDEQLRLTDLIPRRMSVILPLFVLGLLAIAGLESLYASMLGWAEAGSAGPVAALDLASRGSLAGWFSSAVLLASAVAAVLVYTVRRYKRDDYQGHYRVWLWAALCGLLLSVDASAGLHDGFAEMMTWLTGTPLAGDGSMWWMVAYFFLLGGVGTRLAVDMRSCRTSMGAFVLVPGAYAVALAVEVGWISLAGETRAIMLAEGARMVGNLLLLLATTLHARHVILDAEGLLPARPAAAKKSKKKDDDAVAAEDEDEEEYDEEPEEDEEEAYEYDTDEVAAEQAILFGQNVPLHGGSAPRTDAYTAGMKAAESSVGRRLTAQEKKALRRRLEKQRKMRERRSA